MRLTRFTDNALRCLLVLGLETERAVPGREIAARMRISYEHLVKIIHRLAELGYVETHRGRRGGMRLALPAAQINIGALVRRTEENLALVECFDATHNTCPIASACHLADVMHTALEAFLRVLDQCTLADALVRRRRLVALMRSAAAGADLA